jgi:hexulose-6-phosphate isomerase
MKKSSKNLPNLQSTGLDRREMLAYSTGLGSAFLARQGMASKRLGSPPLPGLGEGRSQKRYDMKKSINMWAFPYPDKWSLEESFQLARRAGFDGIELNFNLTGEFSAESTDSEIEKIRKLSEKTGISISGVCSFLYWPYSMTHNDPTRREKGIELALKMIRAARLLGTENLLVVPGAVYVPWIEDSDPVPNDVCDRRARQAVQRILPVAEEAGVSINIENIFANGFLFSPQEVVEFVDSFESDHVKVHFDTGNIMHYQFPEHWVPILGKRIKNVHFKEWDKRTQEFNLHTFRTLLDGTTNWPAVMEELDNTGYRGYLTFEYFHPYNHYPEALLFQTSDALDRMLGRTA